MADPRLLLVLDARHAADGEALARLLLRRRAYRLITDVLGDAERAALAERRIELIDPADLDGEELRLPWGPTAVLLGDPTRVADLARRAGGLPIVPVD